MGSRRYYYKVLTVAFNSVEEAVRFLDLVSRKIKVFQLYARTRGSRVVELTLVGDPAEVTVAIAEIKKIAKTIKEMYRKERGLATYDVRVILDYAKIEAAIPLDVAFKTLELLGYRVEQLKSGKIRTNAEFSKVVEVVEQVSKIYKEMMEMDVTPQAKRIVAMWCVVLDRTPEEAIEELEALGILKRYITTERSLVVLAYNYEEAFKKVKDFIEKIREDPTLLDKLRAQVEEKLLKKREAELKLEELRQALLGGGIIIIDRSGKSEIQETGTESETEQTQVEESEWENELPEETTEEEQSSLVSDESNVQEQVELEESESRQNSSQSEH